MTLKEAIRIVLDELESNSLECRPNSPERWDEALDVLKDKVTCPKCDHKPGYTGPHTNCVLR